ncbi:MAG: radical SAM protein, partial [Bacteroidaceae bacterium]|nr:radical SAM protein [Bacteroidaceae bacterium]
YLKRENIIPVHTVNLNHQDGEEQAVLQDIIHTHGITHVGLGGISGEYKDLRRITRILRDISPDLHIILGGGIVTADPETTMMAFPEVDTGIIGEGEVTITEFFRHIQQGLRPDQVDGLIFRDKQDKLTLTKRRDEIKDLDSLPLPDYKGFNYGEYLRDNPDLSDVGKKYSQVSVIGGRSCKYCCTFCFHPSGTTYRQRSLDSIFAEIDYLTTSYDISYIALREELFATDNRRVKEFCDRVAKYDFDWSIQLRIDNVNRELVNLLKGTRCRYIFLGIESASDTVLKSMNKRITVKQVEEACQMLHEAGLNFRSGVIMGDAAETNETKQTTINWYLNNRENYRLYIDLIIAFPGSILYKNACRQGIIPDKVQFLKDGCPIVNLTKMTDTEFDMMVQQVESINHRQYNV